MAKCKFYKEIQYYSDDNGSTWFPTGLSRKGELIESGSTDCDEPTPPIPIVGKYLFTYSDSSTRSGSCDASSSAITSSDTRNNDYSYSAMTKAVIGNCVTSIGGFVFSGCTSLSSITIPNSVTNIGEGAFYGCTSFSSITIPNSVTSISRYAFRSCTSLTSITIPSSVTNIGMSVFYQCRSLSSVTIGSGVTSIGEYAFYECTSLTSVTIPSGVTSIGNYAFYGCDSLQSITCLATTPPTLSWYAFVYTNNCPIYVPSGSVNAYKTATNWSSFANRIQAIQ